MDSIINTFLICGTLLTTAFLVLLSLPKSQLRFFLLEILGWSAAALAGLYVLCPIDAIPDFIPVLGWIDDGGALIGGIAATITALSARGDRRRFLAEQPRQEVSRALTYSQHDSEERPR